MSPSFVYRAFEEKMRREFDRWARLLVHFASLDRDDD